jgi:hypothetical protein
MSLSTIQPDMPSIIKLIFSLKKHADILGRALAAVAVIREPCSVPCYRHNTGIFDICLFSKQSFSPEYGRKLRQN